MKHNTYLIVGYLAAVLLLLHHQYPFSWDSAEFVDDAYHQWYAHPPGAPVYMLLAWYLPLRAISLTSALAVIIFTAHLGRRESENWFWPTVLLITAPLFLMNFNWIEIYMPALALLMASVVSYRLWADDVIQLLPLLFCAASLYGLSIGVYPSTVFFGVFFASSLLLDGKEIEEKLKARQKSRFPGLFLLVLFLVLAGVITLMSYTTIFAEVGGFTEGVRWVSSIAGEVFEPFNFMRTARRAVISLGFFGGASLSLIYVFGRNRRFIPHALTTLTYSLFLFGGSVHFQEHLLLPLPLLCIIAGYYLRKLPTVFGIVFLAVGLLTASLIGGIYETKDAMIATQVGMINYLPSDSVVLTLANYEHLNYLLSDNYNIYAIDPLHETHTKEPYGTNNKLWRYKYATIEQLFADHKRVYVLNTAFLDPTLEEELLWDYQLTPALNQTLPEGPTLAWRFLRKPASLQFDNITLYRLSHYTQFTYIHKDDCNFELHDYFVDKKTFSAASIGSDVWSMEFEPELGCRTGGINYHDNRFCFNQCGTHLNCYIFGNHLLCQLRP